MSDMRRCGDSWHEGPREVPCSEFGCDVSNPSGFRRNCKKCERRRTAERRQRLKVVNTSAGTAQWPSVEKFDAELAAEQAAGPVAQPRVVVVEETVTQVEEHRLKVRVREQEAQIRSLVRDLSD